MLSTMQTIFLLASIFFYSASFYSGVNSLKITRLDVPDYIRNGTEESVTLDCEYSYRSDVDAHLVVKWFHNDDPEPVYQWIREYNEITSSKKFDGRINTEFEIESGDDFTKYRALNILRPTTELSGKYSCHVASHDGFDSKEDTMVIYAPPSDVRLNYTSWDDIVQITCIVEGVYPLPEIEMFQIAPGEVDPSPVEDVDLYHEEEDDAYNVFLTTNISESGLATDGLRYFGCEVSLPGTEYSKITKVPYFPVARAQMIGAEDDTNGAHVTTPTSFFILLSLALFVLIHRW